MSVSKTETRWVIVTNKGKYVGIPFMLSEGHKCYLEEEVIFNKTFDSKEKAKAYMDKILSKEGRVFVDPYELEDGEYLEKAVSFERYVGE